MYPNSNNLKLTTIPKLTCTQTTQRFKKVS